MELSDLNGDRYCEYLVNIAPDLDISILESVEVIISRTNWLNPTTAQDWNNIAVTHLIAADWASNSESRISSVQAAMESLEKGFALGQNPLCAAHYALVQTMIGESTKASSLAFSMIMSCSQLEHTATPLSSGLIYLPLRVKHPAELALILETENGYTQALMVLAEVLWRSQLVFYNSFGMRSLSIGSQIFPDSPSLKLMAGIGKIMSNAQEGMISLHQAHKLQPFNASTLQALYLGYRTIGNLEIAKYWFQTAAYLCTDLIETSLDWQWTKLPFDAPITYLAFENNLVMAVEPNLHSIVTSILIGQQDWFEDEMEFWRGWIKQGMTVIDVGANAGVYAFSAANKVGDSGLVLAIEPFSKCVEYLKETCKINNLTQVKVIAAAASDRQGIIKLGISSASELNQIITDQESINTEFEEAVSITLDSLVESESLQSVDILKVDAEGHEISVFKGSEYILDRFSPTIMYENLSGTQSNSLPVAEFLTAKGYMLFTYKPYLQKLMPLNSEAQMQQSLNIIAIKNP
jgi:FkbM family methyltransferase